MKLGAFITGSGTGVGKTFVTRGLARAFARRGRCYAVKPIETGATPDPLDALALARACGHPELARIADFYRTAAPVAPYAAQLHGDVPPPDIAALCRRLAQLGAECDALWVEGAGGLLVPLDARASMADLARELQLPLIVVAADELGVLSHVLTCAESAAQRALDIAATVLVTRDAAASDPSVQTNQRILQERLAHPVLVFPRCVDDDEALANAAEKSNLVAMLVDRSPGKR